MATKTIHEAVVLREGWEMDNRLWVTEDKDGKRHLRTTSHLREYEAEMTELDEVIKETRKSLEGLLKAKALMEERS